MSDKTLFTKEVRLSQTSVLNAKKKNFFKRSIWKYLLAVVILTVAIPDLLGSPTKTFIGLFLTLISISVFTMLISAKFLADKLKLDAKIEFKEDSFLIRSKNTEEKEQLINWKSVFKLKEFKNTFIIDLDKTPPHLICIEKEELEKVEIEYFRDKITKNH